MRGLLFVSCLFTLLFGRPRYMRLLLGSRYLYCFFYDLPTFLCETRMDGLRRA